MELVRLVVVFLAIIVMLKFHLSLSVSVLGGIVATILLFQVPLLDAGKVLVASSISKETLVVVLFSCMRSRIYSGFWRADQPQQDGPGFKTGCFTTGESTRRWRRCLWACCRRRRPAKSAQDCDKSVGDDPRWTRKGVYHQPLPAHSRGISADLLRR